MLDVASSDARRNAWKYQADQTFTPRSVAKTNPADTVHLNMVGYTGHVPQSARNCRGKLGMLLASET